MQFLHLNSYLKLLDHASLEQYYAGIVVYFVCEGF